MKTFAFKTSFLLLVFCLLMACKKDTLDCYDPELYETSKNKACTADCPGVIGCDGKTYCNECEANRHGVHIKK